MVIILLKLLTSSDSNVPAQATQLVMNLLMKHPEWITDEARSPNSTLHDVKYSMNKSVTTHKAQYLNAEVWFCFFFFFFLEKKYHCIFRSLNIIIKWSFRYPMNCWCTAIKNKNWKIIIEKRYRFSHTHQCISSIHITLNVSIFQKKCFKYGH